MAYEPSGKIKAKGLAASLNSNPIAALTYNPDYDYQDLPHAPSSISGENMQCYNNEYQ